MVYRLIKTKAFPNVHVLENKFRFNCDAGTGKNATIYPVIMQDEGLGDPNSKYTNPESGSFAETNEANCYPDSRVNRARVNFEVSLTKGAIETDKIQTMKLFAIPIHVAFLENLTAKDEKTSAEVEDILELQHETSDRQTYPLYNGTDLAADFPDLGTNAPGLTTNTNIEGIDFNLNQLYDALQFYSNGKKVKTSIGRIRQIYLSRNRTVRFGFVGTSKTKAMNPYSFFGVLLYAPTDQELTASQVNTDLTSIDHISIVAYSRYNEWNENFNFMR